MSDRGMKKWAPYASLIEQKGTLQRMKRHRTKIPKPLLSEDDANHINQMLYESVGKNVRISYYHDGEILTCDTLFIRLQLDHKRMQTSIGFIPLSSLLKITIIHQ